MSRERLDIRKKYGDDFYNHLKYGGAMSVKILQDSANIPKDGYWADVLSVGYHKNKNKIAIDFFIVEMFPRISAPDYSYKPKGIDKRYETWLTARKDIEKQKERGIHGEIYLVATKLYNKNNDYKLVDVEKPDGKIVKKKIFTNPEWTYKVLFCQKISRKEYKYIDKRKDRLVEKIRNKKGFIDKRIFCLKD